jgi:cation:H+ antiporter
MLSHAAIVWLQLLACVAVIGFAGSRLTIYGDAIADKTGLGGTWIGVIMLGTVTSLPELATGISAVTVVNVPDIAVGDVFGSCVFNLMIIVLLDLMYRRKSLYSVASHGHILSAGFGIMLIGFAGFNVLIASRGLSGSILHVGWYTPVIIVLYFVAMRAVYVYERREIAAFTHKEADNYPHLTLRQAVMRYLAAALFVVLAGSLLPSVAKDISLVMDWHQGFVGTLFVAFVTSLPEIVVTLSALRIGAVNMAIGNLFGSNLFNILVLAIDDLFYLQAPLFSAVSSTHAVTAFSAIMMTGVATVGLLYQPRVRVLKTVSWVSIFLFSIYVINTYIIFVYHG